MGSLKCKFSLLLLVLAILSGPAWAGDDVVDRIGDSLKQGGKAVAEGINKGAREAEPALEKSGKAAADGAREGGSWLGDHLKEAGKALGDLFK